MGRRSKEGLLLRELLIFFSFVAINLLGAERERGGRERYPQNCGSTASASDHAREYDGQEVRSSLTRLEVLDERTVS